MILESIVTTVDEKGLVNIAPMGPIVSGTLESPCFLLRPFESSRTFHNLISTRRAVIHVTDDAMLIAKAAVGRLDQDEMNALVEPFDEDWRLLRDCHRWFAVRIESISNERPRAEMECCVLHSGMVRPFFGFNRAKHAVIEAAILATRTHLLAQEVVEDELQRLDPLIEKTAGAREKEAFTLVVAEIAKRYS